ncbi:MAG: SoxR reducing system RseC family protein [Gammaproteobacteria bacterium]|nr:SoxR reducing system RseC family protein [Gammaproteobacteria bacterium]
MIEETAYVIDTDPRHKRVRIQAQRQTSCSHCSARQGCGTQVLSKYVGKRTTELWLDDPIGLQKGDKVLLHLSEGGLLQGSFLVYMLPLVFILGFAIIFDMLAQSFQVAGEWPAILGMILGLIGAYRWMTNIQHKCQHDQRYYPEIVQLIENRAEIKLHRS